MIFSSSKLLLIYSHSIFFFFNDTATTEIYTLSLHDALPISILRCRPTTCRSWWPCPRRKTRSEEHTSELQSQSNLVCRLLLEKKKINHPHHRVQQPRSLHQPSCLYGIYPLRHGNLRDSRAPC